MKRNLNNKLEMYKQNQVIIYTSFDIPKNLIERTFEEVVEKSDDETLIVEEHDKLMRKYIIDEINNGNIQIKNRVINNLYKVKIIIVKNPRYGYSKDIIDMIYLKAIDLLKYKYNNNNTINMNILNNMKYIIDNNYINTPINKMNIKIYDISFMKEYIEIIKFQKDKLLNELNIDIDEFDRLINGEEKANIDFFETLCIYFDVNTYEELKEKISNEIKLYKNVNIDLVKEKLKDEPKKEKTKDFIIKNNIKCYNLSFMYEYVNLYNIKKQQLSELFSCGINKVDDVLSGKIWIKENLMSDLYIEYRVRNFPEFKAKILRMIKIKNLNNLKYNLKIIYDEYNKKQIKNSAFIDNIDKHMLCEILDIDSKSTLDKNIIKLIFKIGFKNDFSYYDISRILDIDINYIEKIHKESLDIINNTIEESKNIKILK